MKTLSAKVLFKNGKEITVDSETGIEICEGIKKGIVMLSLYSEDDELKGVIDLREVVYVG